MKKQLDLTSPVHCTVAVVSPFLSGYSATFCFSVCSTSPVCLHMRWMWMRLFYDTICKCGQGLSGFHWMESHIHTGGLCDTCYLIPLCTFSSLNGVWVSMDLRNYLNWPLGTPVCFVTPFGNHRSHYNQFIYVTKQIPSLRKQSERNGLNPSNFIRFIWSFNPQSKH